MFSIDFSSKDRLVKLTILFLFSCLFVLSARSSIIVTTCAKFAKSFSDLVQILLTNNTDGSKILFSTNSLLIISNLNLNSSLFSSFKVLTNKLYNFLFPLLYSNSLFLL